MRPLLRRSLSAALLLAPTLSFAASSLVLNDGQVIKGSEIRREGDSYLVTMTGGNTVAFPAALVKEVKFDDDGSPTRWSKDAVDTSWAPTSAYDPDKDVMAESRSTWSKSAVDTEWKPTSGFDTSKDVMAGSRSAWSKSAVDTEWKPADGFGFKPLSFKGAAKPPPELVAMLPKATGPAPWECAEAIFEKDNRAASLSVKPLTTPLYAALGVPLYEANAKSGAAPRKAVFAISGGACRVVGGDVDSILGLDLTPDHAMAQDGASFNAAMASRGGARVPAGVDKLDYALAFVSLTDPQVSGAQAATLKLIATPEELRSIASSGPESCALTKRKRRKQDRAAIASFATPKIAAGKDGDVVTFLTWSGAAGDVYRNTVVLARGGVVSANRELVASHVGTHRDELRR